MAKVKRVRIFLGMVARFLEGEEGVSVFQVFQCFRFCCFSSRLWEQVLPIHFMRGENANDDECSGSNEVVL